MATPNKVSPLFMKQGVCIPDFSALAMPLRKIVMNHSSEYWYIGSILERSETQKNRIWVLTATGMNWLRVTSMSLSVCSAIRTFDWNRHNTNVTWRISSYLLTYLCLSATKPELYEWPDTPTAAYKLFAPTTHPMDHTQVNLTLSVDIRTWTWLRIISIQYTDVRIANLCWAPTYYLLVNFIHATVGIVYINLQPEYELPSSIRFRQCQKFEKKTQLGALSSTCLLYTSPSPRD